VPRRFSAHSRANAIRASSKIICICRLLTYGKPASPKPCEDRSHRRSIPPSLGSSPEPRRADAWSHPRPFRGDHGLNDFALSAPPRRHPQRLLRGYRPNSASTLKPAARLPPRWLFRRPRQVHAVEPGLRHPSSAESPPVRVARGGVRAGAELKWPLFLHRPRRRAPALHRSTAYHLARGAALDLRGSPDPSGTRSPATGYDCSAHLARGGGGGWNRWTANAPASTARTFRFSSSGVPGQSPGREARPSVEPDEGGRGCCKAPEPRRRAGPPNASSADGRRSRHPALLSGHRRRRSGTTGHPWLGCGFPMHGTRFQPLRVA